MNAKTMPMPGIPTPAESVRIPHHVVHRAFVSETVVLNLATGKYYGLNPTAGRMLEVLEKHASIDETAVMVAEEFDRPLEEIRVDLAELCDNLLEQGLLERTPEGGNANG